MRRRKCVPGCRVGVHTTCVNQTMWLSICVSVWADGSEKECGMLVEAKSVIIHENERKVSAANYSPASLLVWQRGHRLLMVEIATNEAFCHAHTHTHKCTHILYAGAHTGTIITGDEKQSAHLLRKNGSGVKLKFKGWLNIITILRAWVFQGDGT